MQSRLLAMGRWLSVNGEAIYGTRPWKTYGEHAGELIEEPDVIYTKHSQRIHEVEYRYTSKPGLVYAIAFQKRTGQQLLKSFAGFEGDIKRVKLVGSGQDITWGMTAEGLVLDCPDMGGIASAELVYHVSPNGSDSNNGSLEQPFATLVKARNTIRELPEASRRQNIRVLLRDGTHSLSEPLVLNVQDGAPLGLTVSYEAFPGEVPILDSGAEISGWEKAEDYPEGTPEAAKGNLWVADIPEGVERFYSLWDENDLIDRARATFHSDPKLPMSMNGVRTRWMERDLLHIKDGPFRNWHNIGDIEIHKKPTRNWVANFLQMESVDLDKKIARTAVEGTYKLSDNPPRKRKSKDIEKEMVEAIGELCNVPEGLTRPGTWIADTIKGKVYLWPKCEDQLKQRIVAPTLAEYIRIDGENDEWGDNDVPVQGIVIKGLTFKHGKRLCQVTNCRFLNSAGTGLRLDLYCQNNLIEGNQLDNLGYTGILLCGYGPGTKDVNKNNTITNNEISRVGRLWFHALSIFVFQSGHNVISHNYIHDTMYDAIVVSGVRPRFFGYRFKDFPNFPEAYPDLREIMRIMRWKEIGGKPSTFKGGPARDHAHHALEGNRWKAFDFQGLPGFCPQPGQHHRVQRNRFRHG
jgi:hypothetical protein